MIGNARGGRNRAIVAAAFLLAGSGIGNAADLASPSPVHLTLGYSAQIFIDVEPEEARTAMKVLAEQILRRRFPNGTSETLILNDIASLEKAFLEKRIDLAGIHSDQYVRLRDHAPIQPVFVSTNGLSPYHQVVLLVRRDAGIRSLADLRDKRLTLSKDQARSVHLLWLETLLMKAGIRSSEEFFSAVKQVMKPSQAILPVFFQQADACLTTQQSFDVARELNPQVGRDLVVLAQSSYLAGGVVVFRTDYDPAAKAKIIEALGALHEDLQGNQILKLFRMHRLLPWRPEYVESVEALLKEHESLKKGLERRK